MIVSTRLDGTKLRVTRVHHPNGDWAYKYFDQAQHEYVTYTVMYPTDHWLYGKQYKVVCQRGGKKPVIYKGSEALEIAKRLDRMWNQLECGGASNEQL